MNKDFFLNPTDPRHRQYEALRASFVDGLSDQQTADKFGYTYYSFKSLKRDFNNASLIEFFLPSLQGKTATPKKKIAAGDMVIELRKRNFSVPEIREHLQIHHQIDLSDTYINQILRDAGFTKLFRRTQRERYEALQSSQQYPEYSNVGQFAELPQVSTLHGGVFLFLPLLMDMGIDRLFDLDTYGSKIIPKLNYLLSYLAVKLLGTERLSHAQEYSFDYGLGVFAGLNVLPKSSSLAAYSYRNGHGVVTQLLRDFNQELFNMGYLTGQNINLDFHSIPYFGEDQMLDRHWVATRSKRMKSILSFFAQDLDTTFLCYSNADIKATEANDEILKFCEFYRKSTGRLPHRLIFDSKLTTYKNLWKIHQMGIKFITLGRRGANFPKQIEAQTEWNSITMDKADRKYRKLQVCETKAQIKDYDDELRQLFIRGNGREVPMRLLTNDFDPAQKQIITWYSQRWRVENNIQENVDFFNLNSVKSPVVVQVNFDIALTLIANSLYKMLARKTKWLQELKPKAVSRKLVDIQANLTVMQDTITVHFGKNTALPLLREWISELPQYQIPWWGNRKLKFEFS